MLALTPIPHSIPPSHRSPQWGDPEENVAQAWSPGMIFPEQWNCFHHLDTMFCFVIPFGDVPVFGHLKTKSNLHPIWADDRTFRHILRVNSFSTSLASASFSSLYYFPDFLLSWYFLTLSAFFHVASNTFWNKASVSINNGEDGMVTRRGCAGWIFESEECDGEEAGGTGSGRGYDPQL